MTSLLYSHTRNHLYYNTKRNLHNSITLKTNHIQHIPRIKILNSNVKDGVVETVGKDSKLIILKDIDLDPPAFSENNKNRIARYGVSYGGNLEINEKEKRLGEYMTLPINQYSVLDAERIERLDENTFRCTVASVKMLNFTAIPIIHVKVTPTETGCQVELLKFEFDGSEFLKNQNDTFACNMKNVISHSLIDGKPNLEVNITIEFAAIVPRFFSILPIKTIEKIGTNIMKKLVTIAVPKFLSQLEKDYYSWATGNNSRSALSTGELDIQIEENNKIASA